MAIKEVTRFKVSNGEIYKDEKKASKRQESINKASLDSFSSETWKEFVEGEAKEESSVWYGIVNDKYGIESFESVFEQLFLSGKNRDGLIKLLTEIVHEEGKSRL